MTTAYAPHKLTKLSHISTRIILPCLPENTGANEKEIYMAFIKAMREGPQRRMETRILTAIHRASDATDNSDAYVTRVLVDMGLMVPRLALPCDFLDHIDATWQRDRPLQHIPPAYKALTKHWGMIGEEAVFLNTHKIYPAVFILEKNMLP